VGNDKDGNFTLHRLELLQCRNDEHGGLSHAGLGLADDVTAEDGLGDALVLD
jgi:hypothetical protein